VEDLVDLSRVKGLHLTRLGRGISTATVEEQLKKVATALLEQVPNLLTNAM
jgi:hypothetical protein